MKQNDFSELEKFILNKSFACDYEIKYMLNRCLAMFKYENLPATIPQSNLELLLQTKGSCFLTKYNDSFYALDGTQGGEYNCYNQPTKFIVSNSALNISKDYVIGVDGVLIKNDFFSLGILPIIKKYCVMLIENHISIRQAIINARAISIISANDDKTKASADIFLKKMVDGELSVIGETPFFEYPITPDKPIFISEIGKTVTLKTDKNGKIFLPDTNKLAVRNKNVTIHESGYE